MLPFKNILIHEDFTESSNVAIAKVMEMYNPYTTQIHLVHVYKYNPIFSLDWAGFATSVTTFSKEDADQNLRLKVNQICTEYNGCRVTGILLETDETVTKSLSRYILDYNIDLVITNRESEPLGLFENSALDTYELTQNTNCAVLSLTAECLKHSIRSILLPVSSFIPERKIKTAIAMSKQFKACIHLMGMSFVSSPENKENMSAFYNTYKMFRECGYEPLYKIVNATGKPSDIYNYATEIKADIVLADPEKQNGFLKWIGKWFNKASQPLSSLQVLFIMPSLK